MLIGWMQFSKKMRARNIDLHRGLGKAYMVAVCGGDVANLFAAGDGGYTFQFHSILSGHLVVVLGSEPPCCGGADPAGAKKPGRSFNRCLGSFPGKV
jgi:hypothetical protein